MVSETLSQADLEFQQGNFDVAASLYAKAVADLEQESGDPKNLAVLLQKLGDSEYAQNNFSAAKESYVRLVELQSNENFSAKDKVSVFLKLAKSADKCDQQADAQQNFQTAYELLSSLSPTHFLRRTVIDAYAEYLRGRGDNAELLEQLENELGIKKSDVAAPVIDEVTPESIPTPIAPKKTGGEEFVVLKSRLGKFSRKKETTVSESEEKAPTVLEKKADKTVEQEVAERKFLRKGEKKDKGQERTSRRSSLRSAMSQERGSKADGEGTTNEPDITYTKLAPVGGAGEFDATPPVQPGMPGIAAVDGVGVVGGAIAGAALGGAGAGTDGIGAAGGTAAGIDARDMNVQLPAIREMDPTSLPEDMYPSAAQSNLDADAVRAQPEYFYQDKDLAKFVGRRPKRTLRETAHTGTVEIAAPSLAVEAVSMPEATRSFLQQADAIKKSSDVVEAAPDVVPLRAEGRVETVVPLQEKIVSTLKFASPIIGIVIMLAAGIFLLAGLAPKNTSGKLPSFALNLLGRKFVTADSALSINVGKTNVNFEGMVNRSANIKVWSGDWTDEIALLRGSFNNCRWMIVMPQGLKDETGGTFYALDAPERKTIAYCKKVSEAAQLYFEQNKKFPSFAADLGELANYSNPYSGKASDVVILSTVDNKRADSKPNAPLDLEFQSGSPFKGEAAGGPGEVHALSISGQPIFSEVENTYTWTTQCFYIHAFDRNGKLIEGSGAKQVYLLTDKNGTVLAPSMQDLRTEYGTADVCFTQTEKPKTDSLMFKYVAILLGILLIVGFVLIQFRMSRYRG